MFIDISQACLSHQAFSSLAEAAYEAEDAAEDQEEPSTYCLSSSFEIIVQKLLETTDRRVSVRVRNFRKKIEVFIVSQSQ